MTAHPVDFQVRQEEDAVASRTLLRIYVVAILVGALGVFFGGVILAAATGTLRPSFAGPSGSRPSGPELSHIEQSPIWQSRRGVDLREAQRRELERWGWVDRRAGVAKIPIDQAIDIVVDQEARRP